MEGKPFFFDENIFDDDALIKVTEEERAALPEFTRDELEAEKDKAHKAGIAAGKAAALDEIQQKTLVVLEKLQRDLSVLFAAEDDRNKKYETDAVLLSLGILKKLFPALIQNHGLAELEAVLTKVTNEYSMPNDINISLHPETQAHLDGLIKEQEERLQKNVKLIKDNNVDVLDCNISWADGGITLCHSEMIEKTFSLITESLAEEGVSVHDDQDGSDQSDADSNAEENNNNQVGASTHE